MVMVMMMMEGVMMPPLNMLWMVPVGQREKHLLLRLTLRLTLMVLVVPMPSPLQQELQAHQMVLTLLILQA